ncbi:cytochrome P450 [Nocardia brasiliensis]|uniref:cytochrome P450 n=1 Tax=Nocardia brasiliensis TaxID=37326 RepID=UPI0024554A24|nr:cytochrome P450 [Nocardia brasiliensis]
MTTLTSVPMAPKALPVLGHLATIVRDPLAFLSSLPEHGDVVQIRLGPAHAVVVCDPDLTAQVLRNDGVFDKGGPFFESIREFLGNGIATCPHRLHRRQRRLAQPVFRTERIPGYAQTVAEQTRAVTSQWHDGQVLDVLDEVKKITSLALGATMFSDTLPAETQHQAIVDISTLFVAATRRMLLPSALSRLPLPGNNRFKQARNRFRDTITTVIAERRAHDRDCGDLLSALLAARDVEGDGRGLSDLEITDTIATIFVAGSETPGNGLAWACHMIAAHPDIEAKLHAEVDAVLDGRPVTYADVKNLSLTQRVFTETLRMWPPGWVFTRQATDDTQLGGHFVPAGTTVVYSPYLLQHRGDLYPDPDRFDPDRWARDQAVPAPNNAFVAFGGGPRKCLGDQFSTAEAVLVLATIASKWQLRHLDGRPIRPGFDANLRPRGLRMRAVARKH